MSIKKQILIGQLELPLQQPCDLVCTPHEYRGLQRMFTAMWNAYLNKGSREDRRPNISLPFHARQINSPRIMNIALKVLSEANWIVCSTRPNNNWSEAYLNEAKLLEYVTRAELDGVREFGKFSEYRLNNEESNCVTNHTRTKGKVGFTGLNRPGFTKAGFTEFKLDTDYMTAYEPSVVKLVNYGIDKMIAKHNAILNDHVNYGAVGQHIVESYIHSDDTYSSGSRTSDPRGRDNAGYLNKIGNPVGFKVMRSLLTIPFEYRNTATHRGLMNKYLFIAELNGFKSGTKEDKIQFGEDCYNERREHTLDITKDNDLKELPENIWLQRTYDDIDCYFDKSTRSDQFTKEIVTIKAKIAEYKTKHTAWHNARLPKMYTELNRLSELSGHSDHAWFCPIEIDMSASVLGYIGLLLNHAPFMKRCNMIGNVLQDAWAHPVVTNRTQFKTIMRKVYGSQQSTADMWEDMDIPYTAEEVAAFEHELAEGEMAVANALKDFMIDNCNMQPKMTLRVWNEDVEVTCNKFHNVGEKTTKFDLYDSITGGIRRISHTDTVQKPDLQAFATYTVTGMIHGLDNRPMDRLCDEVYEQYGWVLPIHDAAILCAEAADYGREIYAEDLEQIHADRNTILSDYFTSIGIGGSKIAEFKEKVLSLVQPFEGTFTCNPLVLK